MAARQLISLTKNSFVADEEELIRNGLPQEMANQLYENGGFVVITGLPKGIEVGLDYRTFVATEKFLGFKMIPPGLHFVTLKYKAAPTISFFLSFELGTVYTLKWNQQEEDLEDDFKCQSSSNDSLKHMLMGNDDRLAVYPFPQMAQWQQMISHLNMDTVKRLKPTNPLGKYNEEIEFINSEETLNANLDFKDKAMVQESDKGRKNITDSAGLPLVKDKPGHTIFFTRIPKANNKNKTRLALILDSMNYKELLGEYQYSFVCFLIGQSYVGLQQWKALLHLLSDCSKDLKGRHDLFNELIVIIYSQLKLFEDGLIEEIFFGDNFLQTVLPLLFANIEDSEDADQVIKNRTLKLRAFCETKFQQSFKM